MTSLASTASKTAHLGLPNFCGIDSDGHSGGLLLRWDDSVVLSSFTIHSRFILCNLCLNVNNGCTKHDMYVMFIYGEPCIDLRLSLWNNISALISGLSPFLIIGDFNQVEMHSDKLGGSHIIRGQQDFTNWRFDNSLLDVPFFGPLFTWMNNRSDDQLIMERLDRAYANSEWLHLFPAASIMHLPILVSDHAQIILKFFHPSRTCKCPYRLDNWCLGSPEIAHIVACAWALPVTGSPMYILSRRLASVRFSIMQWVIHHRLSHGINWSEIQRKTHCSGTEIVDAHSATNFQQLRSAQLHFLKLQHDYWLQRAKLKNEVLDGLPSRFLYSRVKQRASHQRILALLSSSGEWLYTPAQISLEVTSFFQCLLGATPPQDPGHPRGFIAPLLDSLDLPVLSSSDCLLLSAPFTEHEIICALNGMDGSKSPGPDGITPKFFQMFWPQISQLVALALLRFLNSGVMLKEWNNTHIILIPKVEKPEQISQYRPISLCNVIYRLASKCLVNRLKLVISSIVSDSQQAFVPSRLMSDSCVITHEIMHYLNKTKRGSVSYAALMLDMHKAFDRVSWTFLIAVLKKFGFPVFWQDIIWECISTVTYNIIINGEPSSTFKPSCGLRQGDPLSPYLFIMCMEILSCQLRTAEKSNAINGLKISQYAPPISHLFYVGDAFICCKATPSAFENLRDLLRCFELASGQMINLDKSFIKFSPNAPPDFRTHMASILKMRTSVCFGNYLGVPVDIPSKKSLLFQPLVDRLTSRILAWSSLHLSQPCKLLIINTIILGSIRFLMASIPFLVGICKKIDSLIAAFWWRKDARHISIHWLSRDCLQLPRANGGLGLRSVALLSQATLLKNYWRMQHQPSGLLSRFMVPKYKKDLPIPSSRSKVSHPSFFWSGLCRAANALSPGFAWKLGNGSSVDLFSSPWVNGTTPSVRVSASSVMPVLSHVISDSGTWNHATVYRWFQPPCARTILAMEPPHIDIDDFLYWKYTEDGVYTVRSGYDFLLSHMPTSCSPSFHSSFPWKVLWNLRCSPKLPLLVWRIVHNILPSLDNISVRGLQAIWMVRNSVVFDNCSLDPVQVLHLSDYLFASHSQLSVFWPSFARSSIKISIPVLNCALFSSEITYFIPVHRSALRDCYTVSSLDTMAGNPVFQNVRASTVFAASTKGLLLTMYRAHSASQTSVSFRVTSKKLSSVLASTTPVPVELCHTLSTIRSFLRLSSDGWMVVVVVRSGRGKDEVAAVGGVDDGGWVVRGCFPASIKFMVFVVSDCKSFVDVSTGITLLNIMKNLSLLL
ncbi:uncharacterized protein LOC141590115 [Silene latifolia]|uniref:uncharacterized protein LOC141590115 n=1 Tax=Silene latifolia TaxID=37657 RepID=UPI003D77291E